MLESDAKEYPAGLIADDEGGTAKPYPKKKHIGPIDPRCLNSKPVSKYLWQFARLLTFS